MTRDEIIRFLALRTLGNFLILLAMYGVVMTFGPALLFQAQFRLMQLRHVHFVVGKVATISAVSSGTFHPDPLPSRTRANGGQPGFAAILAGKKEQVLTPIDPLFSILIPKLGIDEKVFPNIDPNDPGQYLSVLQQGIAHAKGSVFPGVDGTTYLFAHSADNWWDIEHYNAIFYTLNNLSPGDEITVFFENHRYEYVVSGQIISDPQDVSYLASQHTGEQRLVLQTCWPPGTTFKRLYVIATPKKV